jgi:hypothetical protein
VSAVAEQKYCTRPGCGKPIKWPPFVPGVKNHPLNMDGTEHRCQSSETAKSKEDSRVGIYGGIVRGQISLTLKNGGIMMSQATPDLLTCLNDPNTAVKNGMKVKIVFAKDGKAEKAEVCPDQPTPVTAAALPAAERSTETCTSPALAPEGGIGGIVAATKANAMQPLTHEEDIWGQEREEFCNLLTLTGREGMPDLLQYLIEKTDFFIAPSSTKYHDARDGGLLHHSLTVYHNLVMLSRTFAGDYPADSLIIIGLLHDLCKANFYKLTKKSLPRKDDNGELILDDYGKKIWDDVMVYDVEDQFPAGHGEKSVILVQRYIQLTDEEIMAICWHMGAYDDRHYSYGGNIALTNASEKYPITVLMHIADLSASFLKIRTAEQTGV